MMAHDFSNGETRWALGNGSIPRRESLKSSPLGINEAQLCAISSVVERLLHTQEVAGSNPASRMFRYCLVQA